MTITIADIAREAGVSTATVSYALRHDPRVRDQTATAVRAIAERMNYQGNASARSLRLGRSGVIAVAVHDLSLPFSGELAAAISSVAAGYGYQTLVQQTLVTEHTEMSMLKESRQQFCDGTIFCGGELSARQMKTITKDKPLVILDPRESTTLFDTVYTPSRRGAYAAVAHLLKCGCRRVGVIGAGFQPYESCVAGSDIGSQRLAGCFEACRDFSVPFAREQACPVDTWTAGHAGAAVTRLVRSGQTFDGLFCLSDTMALGAMHALRTCDLEVPGDVGVVGFDGIGEGAYSSPPLSTVALSFQDLAGMLVELLLERIEHRDGPSQSRMSDFSLVVRGSTRRG